MKGPKRTAATLVNTMTVIGNAIIALTIFVCVVALSISIYPGVLNDLVFTAVLLSFVAAPVVGIVGIIFLVVLAPQARLRGLQFPWMRIAVAFAILICTYILLKLYVPRRIAFELSRDAFEQVVSETRPSNLHATFPRQRVGIYKVDEYATDPRGGIYFRVHTGFDGIGPDQMSYGFVHKPNQEGTPFGAAGYRLFSLGSDWYWFRASNDRP